MARPQCSNFKNTFGLLFGAAAQQVLLRCQLGWQALMLASMDYSGADCLWPSVAQKSC